MIRMLLTFTSLSALQWRPDRQTAYFLASENELICMGLLRHGCNHDLIVGRYLPGRAAEELKIWIERSMLSKDDNIIKVGKLPQGCAMLNQAEGIHVQQGDSQFQRHVKHLHLIHCSVNAFSCHHAN